MHHMRSPGRVAQYHALAKLRHRYRGTRTTHAGPYTVFYRGVSGGDIDGFSAKLKTHTNAPVSHPGTACTGTASSGKLGEAQRKHEEGLVSELGLE